MKPAQARAAAALGERLRQSEEAARVGTRWTEARSVVRTLRRPVREKVASRLVLRVAIGRRWARGRKFCARQTARVHWQPSGASGRAERGPTVADECSPAWPLCPWGCLRD